jgi:hypothetical protein
VVERQLATPPNESWLVEQDVRKTVNEVLTLLFRSLRRTFIGGAGSALTEAEVLELPY